MDNKDENFIEQLNKTHLKMLLTKRYKHLLSLEELIQIDKETEMTYRMMKENKEYIEENGVTYYLSNEIKEFLKKNLKI